MFHVVYPNLNNFNNLLSAIHRTIIQRGQDLPYHRMTSQC